VTFLLSDANTGDGGAEDDAHHYHRLVVLDILESEKVYVQDLKVRWVGRVVRRMGGGCETIYPVF
jgi:hypothetical protein